MVAKKRRRMASALDLGQAQEFTAWAVVERTATQVSPMKCEYETVVRHLKRFPPGTNYAEIFADLRPRFAEPPLRGTTLVVNQTGVGKPVISLLRSSNVAESLQLVTIVLGPQTGLDGKGGWLVSKKDLVGGLQVQLQNRTLKIPLTLEYAPVLRDELNQFKMKPPSTSDTQELAWRERPHDDLLFALALACWQIERNNTFEAWFESDAFPRAEPGWSFWRRW